MSTFAQLVKATVPPIHGWWLIALTVAVAGALAAVVLFVTLIAGKRQR